MSFEGINKPELNLTPEEQKAHEEFKRNRKILEQKERRDAPDEMDERGILEIKEDKSPKRELTDEEKVMLEKMVPNSDTRADLESDVIEFLLQKGKEEKERGEKREAA